MFRSSLCFLILIGCTSPNESSLDRVVIPIEKPILKISAVVEEIDYTTLHDIPSYFLGNIDKIILAEDLIIAGDISIKPGIIIYDLNGNVKGSINHFGEGPGEFTHINDFSYDPIKKLIILSMVGKIIYYDLEGNFVKESRTETLYYKFISIDDNQILFYLPQVSAQEFIGSGYENGILFLENPEVKNSKRILHHTFNKETKTPYMMERDVFQTGISGEIAFSHYFNDTIYILDRELRTTRKILVDLGEYKLDNRHFEGYDSEIDALNDLGNKALNQNQLLYDGEYLGGRILQDGNTFFFISNLKKQDTWSIGNFENDLDGVMSYLQLRALKEKTLYSVHRIEELPAYILENPSKYNFPENITDNLYFIAKYKLKELDNN